MSEPTKKTLVTPSVYIQANQVSRGVEGRRWAKSQFSSEGSSTPGGDANVWSIRLNYKVFVLSLRW